MKITGMWIIVFSLILGNGYAKTITIATGWRAPLSGDSLPDQGSDSKLVRQVFRHMGHDLKLDFMSWKRAYEITKSGAVVASFSWARTPRREEEMFFPDNPISTSVEVGFYKHSRFPEGLEVVTLEAFKSQELRIVGVSSYW